MVAPVEDEVHRNHFSAPEGQVDLVAGSTGDTEGCGSGIYPCCSLVTELKSGMGNMGNKPSITIHYPALWPMQQKGFFLLICSRLPWCGDGLAQVPLCCVLSECCIDGVPLAGTAEQHVLSGGNLC